jgi:uncharacterized protein involved in type VI secretion and phage assembly
MNQNFGHIAELEERVHSRFHGKYRGIVTDVQDPENRGRIRAKVPFVYGDEVASDWAVPVVPFAGKDHGLFLLPELDDLVWIEFENGNIERPLWTGCSWKKDDLPDPKGPQQRVLTSANGLQIILDDSAKTLQLKHPGGAEITLSDSSISLKLGSGKIEISSSGVSVNDGALEVQ